MDRTSLEIYQAVLVERLREWHLDEIETLYDELTRVARSIADTWCG